jgi:Family of unknown function (DUF6522)
MMTIPTPPVIDIPGGEVTVEASYLAARLGLSVNRLRGEMRQRLVYSVVERGMGENAGRLRLTFITWVCCRPQCSRRYGNS